MRHDESTEVRDHLTEKLTRSRVKLEAKRSVRGLVVLFAAVAIMLLGGAMILSNVAPTLISSSSTVKIAVDYADGVRGNINEIRVKGIPAGRVKSVELKDGQPVITARIKKEYGVVYKDAQAELRPGSALEDMYVDIVDRGHAEAGRLGENDVLAQTQTTSPVNINDVLAVFKGSTRARMRALLDDLGHGLEDRGARLRIAFEEAVPLLQLAGDITHELAIRRPMTERLVHNTAVLTRALGDRDQMLRTLIDDGSATLSALRDGRADLDATLRELPPTIAATNSSFAATRAVLPDLNAAVRSLYPVADDLPGSLAALRELSVTARPAVSALRRPVRRLVPLVRTLQPLSDELDQVVTRLRPQVPVIERTARNLARCEKGIQGFFQYDASMTKFVDIRGLVPRGNFVGGGQTLGVPAPDEFAPQACTPGKAIGGRPPRPSDAH